MIRAVLDANVLASGAVGFLRPTSTPGELARRWLAGGYELMTSEPIRAEVERTLQKPYFLRQVPDDIRVAMLNALERQSTTVVIMASVVGVASHPEDDLVLATAASANAGVLVTGDRQLQGLGVFQGVKIVSPREFLDILGTVEGESRETASDL